MDVEPRILCGLHGSSPAHNSAPASRASGQDESQEVRRPVRSTDGDAGLTLKDVWNDRSASTAFPLVLAEKALTAASFFSAAFYGRNDVIYLDQLGIPNIILIDTDQERLAIMARIYPTVTETYAEDAYQVASRMSRQGRTFDVVVCDPFTNQARPVLVDHFDVFAALAGQSWITGIGLSSLAEAGIESTVPGVQAWLDDHGRDGWEACWLEVRNDATGLAWLGLRRRPREALHED